MFLRVSSNLKSDGAEFLMKKKHFSGDFGPKGSKKGSKQCFSSFVENRYVDFFYFLREVILAYKLKIDLIEGSDEKSCINVF